MISSGIVVKMGELPDMLARKLNLRNGQKLTTKRVTAPKKAHETDDDIAILSMIMPGEKFRCHMAEDCILGDPSESSLGM